MKLLLSLLCLAPACAATNPISERPEFQYRVASDPSAGEQVLVDPGHASIRVKGTDVAPGPTYKLRADRIRKGSGLQLLVIAYLDTPVSTGMLAPLAYEATIPNLPPGKYRLRVVHRVEHGFGGGVTSRETTRLHRQVEVR
jgi:hypothetical protein